MLTFLAEAQTFLEHFFKRFRCRKKFAESKFKVGVDKIFFQNLAILNFEK